MKIRKLRLMLVVILLICMPINVFAGVDFNQESDQQYFKDIGRHGWAKEAIHYLARAEILAGDGKGNYLPNSNVTREEFATMLSKAFNVDQGKAVQTYCDVPTTRWSNKYIESVKEYLPGFYPPKGKPSFEPSGYARREDVAVALVKMLGLSKDDLVNPNVLSNSFKDAKDVSYNLRVLMALAVERKIMVGSNGVLRPTDPITRAEVAVLLHKVIKTSVPDVSKKLDLNVSIPETTNTSQITIKGKTAKGARVEINEYSAQVDSLGYFEMSFTLKSEGQFSVEVLAIKNGSKAIEKREFKYEIKSPEIVVTKCPTASSTSEVTIEGTLSGINDLNSMSLTINDKHIDFNKTNSSNIYTWSYNAKLKEGNNEFRISAKCNDGKEAIVFKTITYYIMGPELIVTQCPEVSSNKTVTISGTVKDINDSYPKVYINDASISVNSFYGSWSKTFTLSEGKNTFVIRATNNKGKATNIVKEITFNIGAPELTFTNCPEVTELRNISIKGNVKDVNDGNVKLYMNDKELSLSTYNKEFSTNVPLSEGENTYIFRAVNSYGKSISIVKTIKCGTVVAPVLKVNAVPETTTQETITISGTIQDSFDSTAKVYVNDIIIASSNGVWSTAIKLKEGTNNIIIVATNKFGKSVTILKKVTYSSVR